MKSLFLFPLMFVLLLSSCHEDGIVSNSSGSPKIPWDIGQNDTIFNVKNKLFSYVNQTVSEIYPVSFKLQNAQVLNKKELTSWIKKNESNKSKTINQGNQALLEKVLKLDKIEAILVKTDQRKPFSEAIYILVPEEAQYTASGKKVSFGAILITDAYSYFNEEEETEVQICQYQYGTSAIRLPEEHSPTISGCPPCVIETVDCSSSFAGEDDCIYCTP